MARGHDPISRIVQNLFTIQRMGNSIQAEGQVLLDALFDAIAADIEHIDPTGPSIQRWRRFRANQLIERVEERLAKVFPEWEKVVQRDLARAGASQGAFAEDTLIFSLGRTAAKGVVRKTPITLARANTILNTHPFGGISGKHVLADWAGGLEAATREAIVEQIRMGMLVEEGIPDLVRRVRGARSRSTVNALGRKVPRYLGGVWKSTTRDATAIVRTAVTSISATAQLETYQKNANVVQGIQYSSVIDSRTTELCMSLDGTIWPVNSPNIVVPGVGSHVGCRSSLVPVVNYEKFGLTPPKDGFRKARDLSGLSTEDLNKKISTRRSQGLLGKNKNIRSSTTAEQWLRGESQRVQNHMLGPGKAKLFREGKITLKDMVRDDLTTVPLSELLEGLP